ncbi:hypothetical protein [Thermosulfurimonas dismutans]|nr:hypothetical protein [Thermosulfurimonas dismutans]
MTIFVGTLRAEVTNEMIYRKLLFLDHYWNICDAYEGDDKFSVLG